MADDTGPLPENAENQVKSYSKLLEITKELARLESVLRDAKEETASLSEKELASIKKNIIELKDQINLEEEALQNLQDKIALLKNENSLEIERSKRDKNNLEIDRLSLELRRKRGELSKKEYEDARLLLREEQVKLERWEKIKGIARSITGEYGAQIEKMLTLTGLISTFKDMMDKVTLANQEFARETGRVADFSATFGIGLGRFGVGYAEQAAAFTSLYTSMSGFTNLSKDMQEEMSANAAKLEKLGIAASTQGKIMNDLTKSFQMTGKQATNTMMDITRTAAGIGIAPKKMMEDMAAVMPRIAVYGKEAINVFKDLEKQSKSLGIEINSLTKLVGEQWDTFEGSAKAAAGLNASLGGPYLNSIEMMNAKESERIVLIKKAMDMSGMQFERLDKWTQKNIALKIGLSDASEALKVFSKNTSSLEADMRKDAVTQEELNKAIAASVPIMNQLKQMLASVAVAVGPLVSALKSLIGFIVELNDNFYGLLIPALILWKNFGFLRNSILGVWGTGTKITTFFTTLTSSMFGTSAANTTVAATSVEAAAGLEAVGVAAASSTAPVASASTTLGSFGVAAAGAVPFILALGAAALMMGGGVYFAAKGVAELVKAFSGLNAEQISGALTAITLGVIVLVPAITALGAVSVTTGWAIAAVGAAFIGIGFGVKLASEGIIKIIDSLKEFISTIFKIPEALMTIKNSISGMVDSFDNLKKSIGEGFINNFSTGMALQIGIMTFAVDALANSLNKIPDGKAVVFSTLNETLNTAKTIKDADLKPATDFIQVVKQYYEIQAKSKDVNNDALLAAVKELNKTMGASKEDKGDKIVKLIISGGSLPDLLQGRAVGALIKSGGTI